MHACGYLSACCQALGIASPAKEYVTCRRIMFRHGAGSAVDRIRRLYPEELEASKEASAALEYLDKRRENMRYGWLRRNGFCISSSHVLVSATMTRSFCWFSRALLGAPCALTPSWGVPP